jgi:hypothetical protein
MRLRKFATGSIMARRLPVLVACCLASALLVSVSVAQARPPVLLTVGADGGRATALWTKESEMKSRFIEIATQPEVNEHGYFRGGTIFSFSTLGAQQTTFKDACQPCVLQVGAKYFVHVATEDSKYFGKCPGREFSNMMSLVLNQDNTTTVEDLGGGHPPCPPTPAGTVSGGTPPPSSGPGPDRLAPFLSLKARKRQDIDKLYVTVRPNEQVTINATGSVNTSGRAAKVLRFKRVTRSVAAQKTTKLRLRLTRKSLRTVKRTLRRGKRLRAKLTLTAKDRAGNTRIDHVSVRLRS